MKPAVELHPLVKIIAAVGQEGVYAPTDGQLSITACSAPLKGIQGRPGAFLRGLCSGMVSCEAVKVSSQKVV